AGHGHVALCWSIALEIASRFLGSDPLNPALVLVVLARVLVVGLAALVALVVLGLPGEIARVGAGVTMGRVFDQLLLGQLEALGLAAAALADRALLFSAALVQVVCLELIRVVHRPFHARLTLSADFIAGG